MLGLPLLKGPVAFAATTSIACAGLVLSYALPILLRLIFARQMDEVGPFSLGRYAMLMVYAAVLQGLMLEDVP